MTQGVKVLKTSVLFQLFQVVLLLLAPALISCYRSLYPTDCSQIEREEGDDDCKSGRYRIYPAGENSGVAVFCEMSRNQAAWTVFQTRSNGLVNFFRPWNHYKLGFGLPMGEHWLGLDNLHYLTSGPTQFELQVDIEDFEGNTAFAHYSSFSVDSECNGYRLSVSGFTNGPAGDALAYSNGMNFTTFDRDQDYWYDNCAKRYLGAFWYRDCHQANPNGVYLWGQDGMPTSTGVTWYPWKLSHDYSLKSIVMKIRPVQVY
nr:PREDICTED: microfibril-associated glycoprotein 4-like [Paralichthys olivaceus]